MGIYSQVLDADKSCHNAVSRVIAWLSGENVELPSQDTGAYCQARQRLPEKLLQQLFSKVAQGLQDKVTQEHLWCGRHVKVIDGSTVSLVFVKKRQADAVFRKHQGRKQELRRGRIVGSCDKQVVWHKPKTCPKALTKEEFATLPLDAVSRELESVALKLILSCSNLVVFYVNRWRMLD